MMMDRDQLETKIESKRAELVNTAMKYGLSSKNTIRYSQELDILLNEYIPLQYHLQKKMA
ncbi:aspartyl-phosphate phosphatase Spo0E family protein [Pradoshia eiseniae]